MLILKALKDGNFLTFKGQQVSGFQSLCKAKLTDTHTISVWRASNCIPLNLMTFGDLEFIRCLIMAVIYTNKTPVFFLFIMGNLLTVKKATNIFFYGCQIKCIISVIVWLTIYCIISHYLQRKCETEWKLIWKCSIPWLTPHQTITDYFALSSLAEIIWILQAWQPCALKKITFFVSHTPFSCK